MNNPVSASPEFPLPAELADGECLRRFVTGRDEAAFGELVRRHVDLVHTAAVRRLAGDAHAAQDVTQQVFTALARQAARLPAGVVLPAWLYATTRHLAANWVRAEQRRRAREQAAHIMDQTTAAAPAHVEWERVRPLLDDVLDELGERDRGAILLRFFSRRSFAEIGAALQVSEDAARMRVDRALEKLRATLVRRGVVSTAAALGGLLSANAVVAAPAGLGALVAGIALQQGAGLGAFLFFMTTHKLPVGLAAATLVAGLACLTALPRAESSTATATATPSPAPTRTVAATVSTLVSSQPVAVQPGRAATGAAPRATTTPAAAGTIESTVERRVQRLDALVGLTAAQRTRVAEVFARETMLLAALPAEVRGEQGRDARLAARADVRAALDTIQRRKFDVSPQTAGGGLAVDPAQLAQRLGQVVTLTPEQQTRATEILWADVVDQVSALRDDEQLKGFLWKNPVREKLRALLTPEQQAIFDRTTPYKMNR